MADAADSKSAGVSPRVGSSPTSGTTQSMGDRMRRMIRVSLAAVVLCLTFAPFALADENPAHQQPGQRLTGAEHFVLTPAHPLTADEQNALRSMGVMFDHTLTRGRYVGRLAGG